MPRSKKNGNGTNGHSHLHLHGIKPLTDNQQRVFEAFDRDKNLVLHGYAGTGKTFLALWLALDTVLNGNEDKKKIFIIRSAVATRNVGFLPGNLKDKSKVLEAPYEHICNQLFSRGDAYEILVNKGIIEFMTTSYIRGVTFDDCFVIVDETENCSLHECDSLITRAGRNCNYIFAGDFRQTDLRGSTKNGFVDFMDILRGLSSFETVEFNIEDIVRSAMVKEYIIAKTESGL